MNENETLNELNGEHLSDRLKSASLLCSNRACGAVCFTSGAVIHSVCFTALRRLGQDKCYLTSRNGGAMDLVSPSSKISQRLYCSLKVHKEGGEERFAAVQ